MEMTLASLINAADEYAKATAASKEAYRVWLEADAARDAARGAYAKAGKQLSDACQKVLDAAAKI